LVNGSVGRRSGAARAWHDTAAALRSPPQEVTPVSDLLANAEPLLQEALSDCRHGATRMRGTVYIMAGRQPLPRPYVLAVAHLAAAQGGFSPPDFIAVAGGAPQAPPPHPPGLWGGPSVLPLPLVLRVAAPPPGDGGPEPRL